MSAALFDRRGVLLGLSSATALAALGGVPASAAVPTRAELELYYTLLWAEFRALSDEMGVEMFDSTIAHGYGGPGTGNHHRIVATIGHQPASSRARAVLSATGLIEGSVQ